MDNTTRVPIGGSIRSLQVPFEYVGDHVPRDHGCKCYPCEIWRKPTLKVYDRHGNHVETIVREVRLCWN